MYLVSIRDLFRAVVVAAAAFLFTLALFTLAAVAQTGDAEINGLIKDPSGSAVPGASVSLTNQDTGVARSISTDADGRYRFYPVPPGRYSIKVEVTGFKTAALSDLQISLGTHVDRDIALTVGSVQESVAVTGDVPTMDVKQ